MAQIYGNWTAPTFSFDAADHPTAWRDFYLRATDYLELLRIQPKEEDQLKRGWEQITTMFTGESRQILQTLIDNNIITAADQQTPILALKAIQTATENKEHHQHDRNKKSAKMATNSAAMATKSTTECPWKQFYKHIIKYMDNLHTEACEPQMKIARFMDAIKHNFASTTTHLTKEDKKSTKEMQTTEQPRQMVQDPSSSTSNSNTDSSYSTESESNYAAHLPRPPCSPKPTRQHSKPSTCSQSITILEKEISSTQDHQQKPSTST